MASQPVITSPSGVTWIVVTCAPLSVYLVGFTIRLLYVGKWVAFRWGVDPRTVWPLPERSKKTFWRV